MSTSIDARVRANANDVGDASVGALMARGAVTSAFACGYRVCVLDTTIDASEGERCGKAIVAGRARARDDDDSATTIKTRLTISYAEPSELQMILGKYSSDIDAYDVLALEPLGEKAFASACANKHADVVSVRANARLKYKFTANAMKIAMENKIFFELCYSDALKDSTSRRWFFTNASALARATRGGRDCVVLSSGATKPMEIRTMYDVANLATFFGMSEANARAAMTENVERMLTLAKRRRIVDFSASSVERMETT